jgi:hypothetical protein
MRDPVERMVQFVAEQRRRAAFAQAQRAWSARMTQLLPTVQAVVEVFTSGLEELGGSPVVTVLADGRHDLCPLVIAFRRRALDAEGAGEFSEIGASAAFRCEPDGAVYGFRYPFHGVTQDVRPERFADLGPPQAVDGPRLGHAVCDFLEWASVGEGCGSRKLRFGSAEAQKASPPPLRLAEVA